MGPEFNQPRAIMVDTFYKPHLLTKEVDVEQISPFHFIIYTSRPNTLTKQEKLEAISKFVGEDLTYL